MEARNWQSDARKGFMVRLPGTQAPLKVRRRPETHVANRRRPETHVASQYAERSHRHSDLTTHSLGATMGKQTSGVGAAEAADLLVEVLPVMTHCHARKRKREGGRDSVAEATIRPSPSVEG